MTDPTPSDTSGFARSYTDPSEELESLLQFLYASPIGVIEFNDDGRVAHITPQAINVLAPTLGLLEHENLYALFEPSWPELRRTIANFNRPAGQIVFDRELTGTSGRYGRWWLSCSVTKVGSARNMMVVAPASDRVAENRELRREAGRQQLMASIVTAVESSRTFAGRAQALVDSLVPELADYAIVEEIDGDGTAVVAIAHRTPDLTEAVRAVRTHRLQTGEDPLAVNRRVAREPVLVREVTARHIDYYSAGDAAVRYLLERLHPRSYLALPLTIEAGRPGSMGLLLTVSEPDRPLYDHHDLDFVIELGSRASLALETARVLERHQAEADAERRIALTMQESLRGDTGLDDHRVEMWGQYRPAVEGTIVGGDWYDVTTLGDGRIALNVGDVVGHGIEAATIMGRLRNATLGIAQAVSDPAAVLRALDSFADTDQRAYATTCVYAVIDPLRQQLEWVSAGHCPLLMVDSDGECRFLYEPVSPPLAVFDVGRTRPVGRIDFPVGSVLIAYTDGLIERRGEPLDTSFELLRQAVIRRLDIPVDELGPQILTEFLENPHQDDAILVIVKFVSQTSPTFSRVIKASPAQVPRVRHDISLWLHDLDTQDRDALALAASEAVTNSIMHAYPSQPDGRITISGDRTDPHAVIITVEDHGRWQDNDPGGPEREGGLGLTFMRTMVDDVDIITGRTGTQVRIKKIVSGPPDRSSSP